MATAYKDYVLHLSIYLSIYTAVTMCDYIETDDIHSGNVHGLLEVNGVTVDICHGVNVQRLSNIPSLVDKEI